jgi:signal transduction histidine kinase
MEEQGYYTEKRASMGTLAAGVAHEINNPLAIILGFTDMLLEKTPADSEHHDILKTIESQGHKAKKVVDNLLTFARTKEHTETSVDINKNIEEVLTVLGNNLLVRKVSINTLDLGQNLPPVKGDPDELQQVFLNVINNAVYAMKKGGTLSLSTRLVDNGKWIEIRISDTGSGIRKEHRKNIFDPLFTTKKVGDGTGLGLSVSYGIITRHRGIITFETKTAEESDSPGTTFMISLPVMPDSKNQRGNTI